MFSDTFLNQSYAKNMNLNFKNSVVEGLISRGYVVCLQIVFHKQIWDKIKFCCTFTFTFSHLADAFVQSDVQGREQSS